MNINLYIKNLRIEQKSTLHQVAVGTNIDGTLLSKIERGERLPTVEQVEKLASFFGILENELKVQFIAEKIIKDYGINDITLRATFLVQEKITIIDNPNND